MVIKMKRITDIISKMCILPFSEEMFFENDHFGDLIKSNGSELYKSYDKLKNTVQKVIRSKYNCKNVDMINLLFQQYYPISIFQHQQDTNSIFLNHIKDISESFISHRNGKISVKYWKNKNDNKMFSAFNDFNKIELWNTFSRQFCTDILVVMYLINNDMSDIAYLNGYYWLVNIADLQVDQILDKGVGENHIHINTGMYFNTVWEDLMNLNSDYHKNSGVINYLGKDKYLILIKMCAVVRAGLCKYLLLYENSKMSKFKLEDMFKHFSESENLNIDESGKFEKSIIENYKEILINFYKGKPVGEKSYDLKNTYEYLTRNSKSIKEMFFVNIETSDENIFLFKSMLYITRDANDEFFSSIFWQYIKLKNIVYSCTTQNNSIEGLDYFTEFYARASEMSFNYKEHLELAIKNQIYNNNLKKLEIRVAPSSNRKAIKIKKDIIYKLKTFFEVYKEILSNIKITDDIIPNIGIVFHLIKRVDDDFFEKCWYKDKQLKDIDGHNYLYGNSQKVYIETVEIINEIREGIPYISNYIVGIDAASVENNSEPWVFAPVYKEARNSKTQRHALGNDGFKSKSTLGFTYHVGEDYRHLLSGLRHIDEVVEKFGYHAGDRIGHGIALGINVEYWCKENPIVIIPKIEYLENMIWIWGLCYNEIIDNSEINVMSFEREIMTLAQEIYINMDGITLYNLWIAYQKKFNKRFTPNKEYFQEICEKDSMGGKILCTRTEFKQNLFWNEEKLFHAYHCKCYIERMQEIIQVRVTEKDVKLLTYLQKAIRKKINSKGIVVETNPTSNLAISGIERLFHHHVTNLNMNGLENTCDNDKGLIITINSDDPTVFNTSISNELAYIFYLLQNKGYSRDSCLEWIDKIRRWGIDTSFVKERKLDRQKQIEEIDSILERLR